MFGILFFILGLLIGSFLNVVIFRYGTHMGLGGRSRCMSSGKVLEWFELIPVVSFLILRGRSRHTGAKISWQYPLVEIVTGLLFLFSYQYVVSTIPLVELTGFIVLLLFLCIVSSYIVLVAVYDIRHMIIPNEFIYPLIGFSFVSLFVSLNPVSFQLPDMLSILSGIVLALPFVVLWAVSRGKWMGFADAKVALAMGWFLGMQNGFVAVLISFWIGALFGVVIMLFTKKDNRHNLKIPFAPFLLTGLIVSFLYNIDILNLITLLY